MSQLKMHPIHIDDMGFQNFQEILRSFQNQKIFLLIDENTRAFCVPLIQTIVTDFKIIVIEIKSGEINKTLKTCEFIWEKLLTHQADRNSLLINLGGGVITDIGGFVAATYKRGINFLNIPTTVLGAADAAIGGKTGIDFKMFKNQIGIFTTPTAVIINSDFFKTLPIRQASSGLAEIIKSALIANKELWQILLDKPVLQIMNWDRIINESVKVKTDIVSRDPFEQGDRKLLNFGHTIGHAVESFSLKHDEDPLLHGEAIALGMICESYISMKKLSLSQVEFDQILEYLFNHYHAYDINPKSIDDIISLMIQDKKNTDNQINFTLINEIGNGEINQFVDAIEIRKALEFYIEYINSTY